MSQNMLASVKQSVLAALKRCGYVLLKSDQFGQFIAEAEETRSQLGQARSQLETACNEGEKIRLEAASLRSDLERSRTEGRDYFDRLVIALDEIRRLKIRVDELPQINYQHIMRQHHEEAQFRDADPAFMSLHEQVCPFTMTSTERLYAMYKATEYVSKAGISGSIVECGVWRGGSMMMAALTLLACGDRSRKLVLFDTFAGLPKPNADEDVDLWGHSQYNEWTRHRRSDTSSDMAFASLEEVRANIASTGYPMENVVFVKGMVQDTLTCNLPEAISLLRLDTDWYESTVCELENLYPSLSKNGVLIIDDYGHLRGQRKAVDEFFARCNEHVLLHRIDYSGRMAIKP